MRNRRQAVDLYDFSRQLDRLLQSHFRVSEGIKQGGAMIFSASRVSDTRS